MSEGCRAVFDVLVKAFGIKETSYGSFASAWERGSWRFGKHETDGDVYGHVERNPCDVWHVVVELTPEIATNYDWPGKQQAVNHELRALNAVVETRG